MIDHILCTCTYICFDSVITAPTHFSAPAVGNWGKSNISVMCNGDYWYFHSSCISSCAWCTATPLHWIYDQEKIRELVDKVGGKPEFYPTSQSPVYNIETGRNGAYGDQLYVTLKSVAENKGTYTKPNRPLPTPFSNVGYKQGSLIPRSMPSIGKLDISLGMRLK